MTLRGAALLFALLLASGHAGARPETDPTPLHYADAAEETRFHALTATLRCVQCQNQSLADSDAPIAHDLRREVLALMRQGRSDAQVRQYLVDRYGEFVLYRPRMEPGTWLLWFGPAALLLAAGAGIALHLRRRGRTHAVPLPGDDQEW